MAHKPPSNSKTITVDRFLPYGRHCIDDADLAAVENVLKSDWLTTGPVVEQFEAEFAKKVGATFAVSCSSGTAGLHLAVLALGLGKNDKIIVPTVTFLATANAARFVGVDVEFCDVDADTGLMTAETLKRALDEASNVKAVFPVHLNGQCAEMVEIYQVAKKYGLSIVEDACHALGGTLLNEDGVTVSVGANAMGDMTVFSLHAVKTITMGEGGVITTNDEKLYKKLSRLRNHGMIREADEFRNRELALDESGAENPWYYEMHELGLNYRASAIHCALGASQLNKLDNFVQRRQEIVSQYDALLKPLFPLVRPVGRLENGSPAWHLYVVLIDFRALTIDRSAFMNALKKKHIGTQVHYLPLHKQPYYQKQYGDKDRPNAMSYYERCLSLPLYPDMTNQDIQWVVEAITALVSLHNE